MPDEISVYKNNINALLEIMYSLGSASDTLIGKTANVLMYQSGKDMGKIEGRKLDKTEDLSKAIQMLLSAKEGVWRIELWKDKGAADYFFEEGGARKAHLVFMECPIRQVCLSRGVQQDGVICRITHGLFAGMMGEVMGRKVDLRVEHAGPNSCKKVVEIR